MFYEAKEVEKLTFPSEQNGKAYIPPGIFPVRGEEAEAERDLVICPRSHI